MHTVSDELFSTILKTSEDKTSAIKRNIKKLE